jgi:hypothetical protein
VTAYGDILPTPGSFVHAHADWGRRPQRLRATPVRLTSQRLPIHLSLAASL